MRSPSTRASSTACRSSISDYVATLSRFLDAGSLGNGGVTDRRQWHGGQRAQRQRVRGGADSRSIRIPYSAEYSRPGRGRIEILTKPGGRCSPASTNDLARDTRLQRAQRVRGRPSRRSNAASTEGFFGGPLGTQRQDVVHAVGERRARLDQQAFIYASGPGRHHPGHAAAQPARQALGDRQHHAPDQRQEHLLDPAELPVRERREPRRRRHDAGERRDAPSRTTSSRSPTRSRRSCVRRC